VLARVQEPRERLASCARRRPGSSLEDAGSIPATSTVLNAQADGWAFLHFGVRVTASNFRAIAKPRFIPVLMVIRRDQ
jgi:hypothetical protein